jgi:hypothetical protein
MYNEMRDLERAIRAHDPDATEEAWEKVTQWLDLSFMSLGVQPSEALRLPVKPADDKIKP